MEPEKNLAPEPGPTTAQAAALFREVLGELDLGVLILQPATCRVLYLNRPARAMLELLQAGTGYEQIRQVLGWETAEGTAGEKRLRAGHRLLSCRCLTLATTEGGLAVFLQDITDQRRLAAVDQAAEIMRNVGDLFSGIRHEIGNPLNAMKMALTVLQANMHRYTPAESRVYLERLATDIARMERLLVSFKSFNMFEKPELGPIDLLAALQELTGLAGLGLEKKEIELELRIADDARWVQADPRALQQVIMNLLSNAVDSLEARAAGRVVIRSRREGETVLLSIEDNGCGMPPDLLRDASKPFFTTKPQGTGLGLALSRKMLAQMDCALDLESTPGRGTTVTMLLPLSILQQAADREK